MVAATCSAFVIHPAISISHLHLPLSVRLPETILHHHDAFATGASTNVVPNSAPNDPLREEKRNTSTPRHASKLETSATRRLVSCTTCNFYSVILISAPFHTRRPLEHEQGREPPDATAVGTGHENDEVASNTS